MTERRALITGITGQGRSLVGALRSSPIRMMVDSDYEMLKHETR
jgi:hypothetical protein